MYVPISQVTPVRVGGDTPEGVLLSYRATDPMMVITQWGDKAHLIHLDGRAAFTHFTIGPGMSVRGMVISEAEFIVDVTSRYDAVQSSDPIGALVLKGGTLFIIATKAGETFGDAHEVPLWGEYESGTEHEAVGFERWSIVVRDGKDRRTLWPQPTEDGHQASA